MKSSSSISIISWCFSGSPLAVRRVVTSKVIRWGYIRTELRSIRTDGRREIRYICEPLSAASQTFGIKAALKDVCNLEVVVNRSSHAYIVPDVWKACTVGVVRIGRGTLTCRASSAAVS